MNVENHFDYIENLNTLNNELTTILKVSSRTFQMICIIIYSVICLML